MARWRPFALYEPYRDTRTTVEKAVMPAFHHSFEDQDTFQRIRQKVEEVCRGIPPKDYISEHLAWHNFVTDKVPYMRDPTPVELVKAPDQILDEIDEHGEAREDCEAIALFEIVGHAALGGPVRIITCSFNSGPRPPNIPPHLPWPLHTHAFAQVQDPRSTRWIATDPVAGARTASMLRRITQAKAFPVEYR